MARMSDSGHQLFNSDADPVSGPISGWVVPDSFLGDSILAGEELLSVSSKYILGTEIEVKVAVFV